MHEPMWCEWNPVFIYFYKNSIKPILGSDTQNVYWCSNAHDQLMLEDWETVQGLTLHDSHYL